MTTALKTGAIHQDWGVIIHFDDNPDGVMRVTPIIGHYNRFPKLINAECLRFASQKGRGVEKTIIRPTIKRLLMDFYPVLHIYSEGVSNFLRGENPLEVELTGLEVCHCKKIIDECMSQHPDKAIAVDYALFGAILKEFYLSVDSRFLPDDFRDMYKSLSDDYYSLGEAMVNLWRHEIHTDPYTKKTAWLYSDIEKTIGFKNLLRAIAP